MKVLGDSWCFCSGGGRSEKIKGSIFSTKGPSMARVNGGATGFLIHRSLLLTTHANLPSVAAAESADVQLHERLVPARLVPHRFFITSSVLDLTIVGIDTMDGESTPQAHQPHYLKTCSNPSLDLGRVVYLLGHVENKELAVGEGKVIIATDNLIKLSTDGAIWGRGTAGFDVQGNLAFMICDPMKLASSPATKSSSTSSSSSSSWKKDLPTQFGIPIPIICDWLNQHWEGCLDELSKPKLPIIRLMSSGHRSEFSSASFTQKRVFKSTEGENVEKDIIPKPMTFPSNICEEETQSVSQPRPTHDQGIPTPAIFESPRLIAGPVRKAENPQTQLLDINFPPRAPRAVALPLPLRQLLPPYSDENIVEKPAPICREDMLEETGSSVPEREACELPMGSPIGACSEGQSNSSPVEISELQREGGRFHPDYSSDGETMYSAETMESRNCPSPKEGKFQQVGRSQSCVNYSRWSAPQRNSAARRGTLEKQRSLLQERKLYSQPGLSQRTRSHDYFSPTVSSIMKKRNEQTPKPRQNVVQESPKWNF